MLLARNASMLEPAGAQPVSSRAATTSGISHTLGNRWQALTQYPMAARFRRNFLRGGLQSVRFNRPCAARTNPDRFDRLCAASLARRPDEFNAPAFPRRPGGARTAMAKQEGREARGP